jgi:hypothetical protein
MVESPLRNTTDWFKVHMPAFPPQVNINREDTPKTDQISASENEKVELGGNKRERRSVKIVLRGKTE